MDQPLLAPKTNTVALVGFIAASVIPVAGLALGIVARRQLDSPNNTESGRGFARWAVIIGALGTLAQVVFFIVWVSMFAAALSRAPIFG